MNIEIEVWKSLDFLGFDRYEVSNFGNVKSLNYNRTGKEKILKLRKDKLGYLRVTLYKNGKRNYFKVHQLVALVFLENPDNLPIINHKDENPLNNHVDNLEWCTHEYNVNYGTRNERVSIKLKEKYKDKENTPMFGKHHTEETKQKISKAISKPIQQYTKDMTFIKEWDSTKQAGKELNIQSSNICSCCKGKIKSAYNFIWRYKE